MTPAQASIAENFDGGITLFSEKKGYGVFLNILFSLVIQWFWERMADMSFLTILSLVSISVPGITKIV
jgi:hypothetical protein